MRRLLTPLVCLACIGAFALPAAAAIPIKVAFHASENLSLGRSLATMKEFIEKESKGKYRVDVYYSLKLGTVETAYQGLRLGTIQMMLEGASNLTVFNPLFMAFDMPFLFPSDEVGNAVVSGPFADKVMKMARNSDITPVRVVPYTHRQFWTTEPVSNYGQLKQKKIRATSSKIHLAVLKALNINGTPMPVSEVYTALQQGVVDGFDMPVGYGITFGWHEASKGIIMDYHMFHPQFFILSTRWWDKVPAEDKPMFERAFDLLVETQKKNLEAEEAGGLERMKARGITVYYPTAEERAQLIKATEGLEKQFPQINMDLVREMRQLAEEYMKNKQ